MSRMAAWTSTSAAQTLAAGEALGRVLQPGAVLGLCGPLGSGKTQFVKGVARGLAVPVDEPIVSPTFVLVREYRGRLTLLHLDTYRLGDPEELTLLGFEEMVERDDCVVAVEWADRFADLLPQNALWLEFEHDGDDRRRITLRWAGAGGDAARAALGAVLDSDS